MAIIREEGRALLHELWGDIKKAIAHRRREVLLMERLHREAASGKYSQSAQAYMLRDRDVRALNERRAILQRLAKKNGRRVNHTAHAAR
jgi:hypothetical protein